MHKLKLHFFISMVTVYLMFLLPNLYATTMPRIHAKPVDVADALSNFYLRAWNTVQDSNQCIEVGGRTVELRAYWCGELFGAVVELVGLKKLSKKQKKALSRISLFTHQRINPIVKGEVGELWQHVAFR